MTSPTEPPQWSVDAVRATRDQLSRFGCFKARLSLLSTDAGGRRHPVMSGWVSAWEIGNDADGHRPDNDATLVLQGADALYPGATADVRLFPTYPQRWSKVVVGDVLRMRDGRHVIGSAVVLEIVEPTNEHLLGRWPMFSTVKLKTDFDGMAAGTTGAVVDVYEDAYEIEIVSGDGETQWLGPVGDEHLEIVVEGPPT